MTEIFLPFRKLGAEVTPIGTLLRGGILAQGNFRAQTSLGEAKLGRWKAFLTLGGPGGAKFRGVKKGILAQDFKADLPGTFGEGRPLGTGRPLWVKPVLFGDKKGTQPPEFLSQKGTFGFTHKGPGNWGLNHGANTFWGLIGYCGITKHFPPVFGDGPWAAESLRGGF